MSCSIHVSTLAKPWDLQTRYSSWSKLLRVTAFILRFVSRLKRRTPPSDENSSPRTVDPSCLSVSEIQRARTFWIKTLQASLFPQELARLKDGTAVEKASPLHTLCPVLDTDGIVRVQGRLTKATLTDSAKRPIILKTHPLVANIVTDMHVKALHAGPRQTTALLRQDFWLLRARTVVRAILLRCVACARARAATATQFMGDLPSYRVTPSTRAFEHTGTDYAGPILARTAPGRGHQARKAYIAIFVCMATKALHLELVSDYSSAAFLAAFQRFISRRGRPSTMYSDNGTNFRGADRELAATVRAAQQQPDFSNRVATDGITWKYIPPNAPHFGGLWEAAVRSVKHHLKRCVGAHTLTFEELTTMLCRIEAILNSRPIAALSESLDDYQALTPGHFLIGSELHALPEPSVLDIKENRLSRWQLLQKLSESFWKAWQNDYLHTLQQRPKWRAVQGLARIGQLVLEAEPNLPPSHWTLGRIIECHPGDDELTRVVTVKTATAVYKRPITKLCFLPVDVNQAEKTNETVQA